MEKWFVSGSFLMRWRDAMGLLLTNLAKAYRRQKKVRKLKPHK